MRLARPQEWRLEFLVASATPNGMANANGVRTGWRRSADRAGLHAKALKKVHETRWGQEEIASADEHSVSALKRIADSSQNLPRV
jgi:hypothetical protein